MEWIKHSLWIKLLVWEVCVCICACMCMCVCEDVRTHACGSSIRFYFTVWWLRYCSERCGRLCWQNQSSDPAVSSPCVCARVCVRANECVCVCVCVCIRARKRQRGLKLCYCCASSVCSGEEWRVRWQQRGLGFMKSINHRDSTTLYLSSSPSVTGNFKCQVFFGFWG